MPFAKDNNMIKTIPSDRADQPLRTPVLPWRPCRDRTIANTHCGKAPNEGFAIGAISIANDISRRFFPAEGFRQLTGNPFSVRMCRHAEPQQLSARMPQDEKSIQQPE